MGTHAKDTWESAGRAALVGGTTTLVEMVCPSKADQPMAAFEDWAGRAEGRASCDYTFHMGVTRVDDAAVAQLREIVTKRGIASFKVFLAYAGAFGVDDGELYAVMSLARELGALVTGHCENATLVAARQAALIAEGKTGPEWHEPSRPPFVEAEGTSHFLSFAEATGAHAYVVHLSCEPALRAAQRAIGRGVRAYVECVAPHLVLDKTYAERPDFEGAKYVMSPPLREASHAGALWAGLRSGAISTVGTDHAPFDFSGQKAMGRGDFTRIPNGIPSVEDRVNLLWTHGVRAGRIDVHQFVAACSTNAAKILGLFPRKGTVQIGGDADLVVYDPDYRGTITAANQQMDVDHSAFEGWEIEGRPDVVTVRGEVMVRGGRFVGTPGGGVLLARDCTH